MKFKLGTSRHAAKRTCFGLRHFANIQGRNDIGSIRHPGYGHVIGGLDDFYKDPANLPIPVSAAIWVVAMKFNGERQQDIGNVMIDLRKRVDGGHFLQRL